MTPEQLAGVAQAKAEETLAGLPNDVQRDLLRVMICHQQALSTVVEVLNQLGLGEAVAPTVGLMMSFLQAADAAAMSAARLSEEDCQQVADGMDTLVKFVSGLASGGLPANDQVH